MPGLLRRIGPLAKVISRFVVPEEALRCYAEALDPHSSELSLSNLLKSLDIGYEVADAELARIPKSGPVVVVANHPFGLLEGLILADMLPRIREDVRIAANSLLALIPGLKGPFLYVNPFGTAEAVLGNRGGVREAVRWLKAGGMLVIFPAGEVSHIRPLEVTVCDPKWNDGAARLARLTGADVLPMHFDGTNSLSFQLMGLLHPRLRTARLVAELLNKRSQSVRVRVGHVIEHQALEKLPNSTEVTRYLRWRTSLLASPKDRARPHSLYPEPAPSPLAPAESPAEMAEEVKRLGESKRLASGGALEVFLAAAEEIPSVLREIGRLRELTFRRAGEGTGKPEDLDCFDRHYLHLFLWNKQKGEVAGAYRLCETKPVLERHGLRGLYTSTLFDYEPRLFDIIGPAMELGRSFVRPEYQKQFAPLLLLWKGIAAYVARRPECCVLFGAVSISKEYRDRSRWLMATTLVNQQQANEIARMVRPRRPLRGRRWAPREEHVVEIGIRDLESLAELVSEIEGDGKGIPILLKQYLRLGGVALGFSLDGQFSDVLDGLILVDLRRTGRATLERYMSKEEAGRFLAYHGLA